MSTFHENSKAFQTQLADAAIWMKRRNTGHDHFWRWQVLTSSNPDREAGRPIFENRTAQQIFEQLAAKKLISPISGSNPTSYLMVYDLAGWENAIAEGRPLRGWWLKVRRQWWVHVLIFVLGVIVGAVKSEAIDLMKAIIHRKPVHQEPQEPPTTSPANKKPIAVE